MKLFWPAVTTAALIVCASAYYWKFSNSPACIERTPYRPDRELPRITLAPIQLDHLAAVESSVARETLRHGASGLYHWMLLYGPDTTLPEPSGLRVPASSVLLGRAPYPHGGSITYPFFIDTVGEIRPRHIANSIIGESHFDQSFAIFAELGFPASTSIPVSSEQQILLEASLSSLFFRYEPGFQEPGFAAIAIASYGSIENEWDNQNGDRMSLEVLLEDMLERPLGRGACGGTHIVNAVARLVMRDRATPFLSPAARTRATGYIQSISNRLSAGQLPDGGWTLAWHSRNAKKLVPLDASDKISSLHITAHHLEWIALCDQDLRPDDSVVRSALRSLVNVMQAIPIDELAASVCPPVHALRCLDDCSEFRLSATKQ